MRFNILDDYDPHPGQARIRASIARFKNIIAGRRWGKDFCGSRDFIRKMFLQDFPKVRHLKPPSRRFIKYSKPHLHYWCVAPDHNIGKIQQRELFSIFPGDFQEDGSRWEYNDNTKELRILSGRILVEFKSADRPDTLVGTGLDGVYLTEFARFKEGAWSANIRPTLTDKSGWGIFTTTPLPRKWFLDIVALGDPESPTYHPAHANFFGKTIDNTRIRDIVEEVEIARKTLPAKYFRREYEASLECFDGQIYFEWDRTIHADPRIVHPRFDIVIAGVDWGYSKPGCIVVIGVIRKPKFNLYYLIDEEYESEILVESPDDSWVRRANLLKAKYGIKIFYCDSEDPGNVQTFRNHGINAVFAVKDVNDGIQSVATAMHISEITGNPNLYVDPESVPNFCKEVISYQWDEDEKPLEDQDDHSLDAARYAIHSFEKYGGTLAYVAQRD